MYWLAFPALLFMWLLKEFSDKDTSIKSCDEVLNRYYRNHERIVENHSYNFKIAEEIVKRER